MFKISTVSLLDVRNTMTSDCLKNCSKLPCVGHITADTEGRKTKGRLQTNPGTWGFQMFPEEEMQDIGEHGNQTGPRIHFTSHNIKHGG
ncbi:hypothetical protein TNCV_1566451 [Trichonephila clavipes]|nr:hypothetical protein TNCV_1566451 [Trichonephila clavipes]